MYENHRADTDPSEVFKANESPVANYQMGGADEGPVNRYDYEERSDEEPAEVATDDELIFLMRQKKPTKPRNSQLISGILPERSSAILSEYPQR